MSFTAYLIAAFVLVFAIWVFRWLRRRGAYYNAADRALRGMGIDPADVDRKYGRGKYQATLEYMLKQGLPPEEAAKAIAADLTGEYNEFLEKLNAEEWKDLPPR